MVFATMFPSQMPNLTVQGSSDGKYTLGPAVQTSESANATQVNQIDPVLDADRQFYVDQAQKQMDYQTNANKIAMDFSAAEAEKQRVYSTEMANTAYQRAVQDLRKAGLNPALAYQQGGAAVPSVSAASGVTSAGSMATYDAGYKQLTLDQERAKIEQAYVEMFVNAATQLASEGMRQAGKNKRFFG